MNLQRVGRTLEFIAGTVVGGLALAFVIVYLHPQLLQPRVAATSPEVSPAAAPAAAPATAAAALRADTTAFTPESGNSSSTGGTDQPGRDLARLPANASATGSFAAAVKRASPAVVNISSQRLVTEQFPPSSAFDQMFGDLQPSYRHRVESALGSGVIVDSAGHIITNNHVIAHADVINVQLADGRVTRATVVGGDPDTDLALLSIRLKDLPVMPLGRSDEMQVGDAVLAIGNPLGLSQTVTHGIVSATGRSQLNIATFENFIQTDAAINAGNSGGALVNERGELIGINTAVAKTGGGSVSVEGIGFAIPVNLARGVMKEILDHGRVIRGWIGILLEDIDDEQARRIGLARGGVVVGNMWRNSPAVDASLRLGDIITAVDGRSVRSAQDTLSQIAIKKPGSNVKLHLLRGHDELDTTVHVTERRDAVQGS